MLGWQDTRPLTTATTPDRAKNLADKPGLKTLQDVLLTFPTRYARLGTSDQLDMLVPGEMYTCVAQILGVEQKENFSGRGPRTFIRFRFTDGSVQMESALFGNPKMHLGVIQPGAILLLHGKLDTFRNQWQLKNPSYVTIDPGPSARFGAYGSLKTIVTIAGSQEAAEELLRMPYLPGYPRKRGTSTAELIGVVDQVLRGPLAPTPGGETIPEMLPDPTVTGTYADGAGGEVAAGSVPAWPTGADGAPLIRFDAALRGIHQPPEEGPGAAIERLKFNEALELQLIMALRAADSTRRTSPRVDALHSELLASFIHSLPYRLSEGQTSAWDRVAEALDSTVPANLMLQGDVGSGKTLIAALAMVAAADAGLQCAFIAPTEVLAVQHAQTLTRLVEGLPITITVLTGSQSSEVRRQSLLDIVSGQAHIVVGTHALIQDSVEFFNLGLVVVDEQHRFGVRQRDYLKNKAAAGKTPHMLVMTATPIPRSVAMTMFGDLEPIVLPGLPSGRGEVRTAVVQAGRRAWVDRMWQRISEDVAAGHQAFVVVPRIEGEDGVLAWAEKLASGPLAHCTVDVLHGKMAPEEKAAAMAGFAEGRTDVLVATTVIEVGVDVPNATVMVIIDAENFGVSQLHQLRGRIGRGSADGWCMLHTTTLPGSASYDRLEAVAATTDGFALAELDLEQRTEGDILGDDQSGAGSRRASLLNLASDGEIIMRAKDYAQELVAKQEELARRLVADIELEDQAYIQRG